MSETATVIPVVHDHPVHAMTTIIVPLDGSETAEQAIPYAVALTGERRGVLTLLSIVDVPAEFGAWTAASAVGISRELEAWVADRERYLDEVRERYGLPQASMMVRVGGAAEEIRRAVEAHERAMIVMTSHGRTGARRLLLGSVANRVVHDAGCPVLVVRLNACQTKPQAVSFGRVVVPLDGSAFGETVLIEARAIFGTGTALHLLRVIEPPSIPSMGAYDGGIPLDYGLVGEYMDAVKDEAVPYLTDLRERLEAEGHTVSWEVREGKVAPTILAVAKEHAADAIAMATHGRGGVSRLVFGSVAQGIIHDATIPVLLLRPE
jgi:nucleotide-binding universal stress UspA family protein